MPPHHEAQEPIEPTNDARLEVVLNTLQLPELAPKAKDALEAFWVKNPFDPEKVSEEDISSEAEDSIFLGWWWNIVAGRPNAPFELMVDEFREPIFEYNPTPFKDNVELVRSRVTNYEKVIDEVTDRFKKLDVAELIKEKGMVLVTDHATDTTPGEAAHFAQMALLKIIGEDFRPNSHLMVGQRVLVVGNEGKQLISTTATGMNIIRVIPPTQDGDIPGLKNLVKKLRIQSTRTALRVKKTAGNILIMNQAGTSDVERKPKHAATDNALKFSSPDGHSFTIAMSVAHEAGKDFEQSPRGVAVGKIHLADSSSVEAGKKAHDELYQELIVGSWNMLEEAKAA